jgi:hypothetical protein
VRARAQVERSAVVRCANGPGDLQQEVREGQVRLRVGLGQGRQLSTSVPVGPGGDQCACSEQSLFVELRALWRTRQLAVDRSGPGCFVIEPYAIDTDAAIAHRA